MLTFYKHIHLPPSGMGTLNRTQLLTAAFCLSLCGLSVTAGVQLRAQISPPPDGIINDDDTLRFSSNFTRRVAFPGAYKSDTTFVLLNAAQMNANARTAEWEFEGVEPGSYYVDITWAPYNGAVQNATVTVEASSLAAPIVTTINQRETLPTVTPDSRGWRRLGTVNIDEDNNTIIVTLTAGVGITMADAVRIVKVGGTITPPTSPCGDNTVDPGEQCDDDNNLNGDGCSSACAIEQGWTCSAGNNRICTRINPPSVPYCGDAIVNGSETCDDGNGRPDDNCTDLCRIAACGDNITQPRGADGLQGTTDDEQCDLGTQNSTPRGGVRCNAMCKWEFCGDTQINVPGETCDDGNRLNGDGCNHLCRTETQIYCGIPTITGAQCQPTTRSYCTQQNGRIYETSQACLAGQTPRVACNNNLDDDGDGTVDLAGDRGCSSATDTNEGDGATDITITFQSAAQTVAIDTPFGLNVVAQNNGPDHATTPVSFNVDIPAGMSFIAEQSDSRCTVNNTMINCVVNRMRPNAPYSFPLTFRINVGTSCTTPITHTARVSATPQGDPVLTNNQGTSVTTVTCPVADCILGDVTGDGTVSSLDVSHLLRLAQQLITEGRLPTAQELKCGDVNKKGNITRNDALLVSGRAVALISLPAMCGDLNNDMIVDEQDFTIATQIANNTLQPAATPAQRFLADANRSNGIDQTDVQIIRDIIDGVRNECFVEAPIFTWCDATGDGTFGATDFSRMLQNLPPFTPTFTADQIVRVDANQSGTFSRGDFDLCKAKYEGRLSKLPARHGDTSLSGGISSTDASLLSQHLQGLITLVGDALFLANTNCDNVVDTTDVNNIIQAAVGIITLPVECPAVQRGNLYVTTDSTPVAQHQVLAGALTDVLLRLDMRAEIKDIGVTMVRFVSQNAQNIHRLELTKAGSASPFALALPTACADFSVTTFAGNPVQTFCAMIPTGQLTIPAGQSVDLLVKARMKTDALGAVSGQPIQLSLDTATSGAYGFVQANDGSLTSPLAFNNGDATAAGEVFIGTSTPAANQPISGPVHYVTNAKITTIANANPDPDNTNVPTGVAPIGQFRFTAATNANILNGLNRVNIGRILFTVDATNVALNHANFKVYNKADSSMKYGCSPVTPVGSELKVQCYLTDFDSSLESGESETFVLEGDITDAQVAQSQNSSLQVSIQNFSNAQTPAGDITWFDQDGASGSSFYWVEYPETIVRSTLYRS